MSKFIIHNGDNTKTVDHCFNALLRDSLEGELLLDFTVDSSYKNDITENTVVEYDGQFFDVASYTYSNVGRAVIVGVRCEHVSYRLNEQIGEGGFHTTGTPTAILTEILDGSDFTVGTVEGSTASLTIDIHGNTYRRTALYQLSGLSQLEIEYDGYAINLRTHRGSVNYIELMDSDVPIEVEYVYEKEGSKETYNITAGKRNTLKTGDNIHIDYKPYDIDKNTRIVAMEYDPYNEFDVSFEVGEYTPDIVEAIQQGDTVIEQQIENIDNSVSNLEETINNLDLTNTTISENTIINNLYSKNAMIADLTVNRLRTDYAKPYNYLNGNTSEVNYIYIHEEQYEMITALCDSSQTERYVNGDDVPMFWTDENHTAMTTEGTEPEGGGTTTTWTDISSTAFNGDYDGYIRYANQLFNNAGAVTASSANGMRIFNISENTRYKVTINMRTRFRLGCLAKLTTGQTVTNYVFDPLDTNDATDQNGAVRTLEITSGAGEIYLIVGAWSNNASTTLPDTLSTIVVEECHTTIADTGLAVMVYKYTEQVKATWKFESISDGGSSTVMPVLTFGLGTSQSSDTMGKAQILKGYEGLEIRYYSGTDGSKDCAILFKDDGKVYVDGVEIVEAPELNVSAVRNIIASETDLTAGSSSLAKGDMYLVYEVV